MKLSTTAGALAIAFGGLAAAPAHAIPVSVELALLVDVSGSVSASEFNLQRSGYANAFLDAGIQNSITNGGGVAATLIYWSSAAQQSIAVGWSLLTDAASATSFANAINAAGRPFSGGTNIDAAINFAAPLFDNNGFEGARLVMDVSGDGASGVGPTQAARDAAAAAGIVINGLPIGGAAIEAFYQNNVITAGGFLQPAADFADFDLAVRTKIGREIVGAIPEPETYALMLLGLGAVGWVARRRKSGR